MFRLAALCCLLALPLAAAAQRYSTFEIIKPAQDEMVHDNTGAVEVELALDPALKTEEGHRITVFLDDAPLPETRLALRFTLENIDRGTHTLRAAVTDNTGATVAATGTVTFHLWRASRLFPGRKP
jgi:hypothetical protein